MRIHDKLHTHIDEEKVGVYMFGKDSLHDVYVYMYAWRLPYQNN
jgi:hypothetical protein